MERNFYFPSDSNNEQTTSQPEEMKIENLRKVKVKTISNQIYSLEVPPTVKYFSNYRSYSCSRSQLVNSKKKLKKSPMLLQIDKDLFIWQKVYKTNKHSIPS